uniref:Uncharacterized protein n=1 Tax=Pithovirus LCPAC401 TaxID=2506595 RepID=A0A481ZBU7_9VIRU|nr:MAG: hypothetical protein LCPAC401_01870 [Pithovirus LCPAC401]
MEAKSPEDIDQVNIEIWDNYLAERISNKYFDEKTLFYLKIYSLRTDSYANSALRYGTYPLQNLIRHFIEYTKDGFKWYSHFTNERIIPGHEEITKRCQELEHPMEIYRGHPPDFVTFGYFLGTIRDLIFGMYQIMDDIAIDMDSPGYLMQVYRGINIPKGTKLRLNLEGFSSSSASFFTAVQFSASSYGTEEILDISKKDIYIFDIEIPEKTRIVPMNICTIQDENEMIIVSQGTLVEIERMEETIEYWNFLYDGRKKTKTLPYTRIVCKLEIEEEYPPLGPFIINPNPTRSVFEEYLIKEELDNPF